MQEQPLPIPSAEPEIACKNCFFARALRMGNSLQRQLTCKRFPPNATVLLTNAGPQFATASAAVHEQDWCFEFRPRPENFSDESRASLLPGNSPHLKLS